MTGIGKKLDVSYPTMASLLSVVGVRENEQLEFKRSTDHLHEPIAAMAMTEGGLVILGIDDDRTVRGLTLTQGVQDVVSRAGRDCGVDVQMRAIRVGTTEVVLVEVPAVRGRIVTTPNGRLLRRVGGDCVPVTGDALARFVRERDDRPTEDRTVSDAQAADIDLALVNRALLAAKRPAVDSDGLLQGLVDLGVAEPRPAPAEPRVLLAAVVLFGRRPQLVVPGATVQAVRRVGTGPGPGPTSARSEFTGPITQLMEQTLAFIATHTRSFEYVAGTNRQALPEYPTEVLREALLNALAHRDYGLRGQTVDVSVWDDRVEIRSPGSLPAPITLENIRQQHSSRNRRVMGALKTLGLVEEFGEGVDRMYLALESRLMEPPIFSISPTSVTVVVRNHYLVSVEDQVWLSVLGHVDLSVPERQALVVARREGSVTPRRLRRLLPAGDVDGVLATAVVKGMLVRIGERGGTRYVLSDEILARAGSRGLEAQSRKRRLLLDEMTRQGSISTSEGAALLDENPATVRHLLNDLVSSGDAVAQGRTSGRRYRSTGP